MDNTLIEMANEAGLEFTGGEKPVTEPAVTPDELGNLSMVWEDDQIEVRVNNIERDRRGLNCHISARDFSKNPTRWICAPVRINLLSTSAKAGLRKELNDRRGLDWHTRLDQVVVAVHKAAENQRQVGTLTRREQATEQDWLLSPLTERNQHSMLVAAGGTGKSMLSLALFASAVTGREIIPGIKPAPFEGRGLYLDWETDQDTHEIRLTQICDALGIPFPEDRIRYIRMAVPLSEDVPFLHDYIVKNEIKFGVGDSVGMATAGDINSQADAIAYVNAVRALGDITFLSVHHIGWGNTDRSTGSRYFENAARSVWVMEKDQEQAESSSHIDLVHRKSNNGLIQASIGIRVEFEPGAIRYYADEVSEDKRNPRERVYNLLVDTGKMSSAAIKEDLPDIKAGTIDKALTDMAKAGRIKRFGRGEYGVLTPETYVRKEENYVSSEGNLRPLISPKGEKLEGLGKERVPSKSEGVEKAASDMSPEQLRRMGF